MNSELVSAREAPQRVAWLDIAKAIGIVAIVMGHTIQGGYIKKYVYSFHVPMFFFLQGISFSVAKLEKRPFTTFLKSRVKSMLIPYYFFSLLSTLAILAASKFVLLPAEANISSPNQLIWEILSGYCDANRPLWFITCSFCISVLGYVVIALSNKIGTSSVKRACFLGIIAVLGCVALYLNDSYLHIYNLFWKVDTAFQMLPFFILGYLMMELKCFDRIFTLSTMKRTFLCVALIACGGVLGIWNDEAGYLGNYYGNISVFYCSALISIIGYILAAELLPSWKVFTYVGESTLSILLMHKFPLMMFQYLISYTKRMLQQHSWVVGIFVSAIAIVVCCGMQEVLRRVCPALIGKTRAVKR